MKMNRFFWLFIVGFLCCFSCNSKYLVNKKYNCIFDKENLAVSSPHSFDTFFYWRQFDLAVAYSYTEFGIRKTLECKYEGESRKEKLVLNISMSNIGCMDTIWARKVIKKELERRYPYKYTFADTNFILKYYNVVLVDSTKLVKSEFESPDVSFQGGYTPSESWILNHGEKFEDIGKFIVPDNYKTDKFRHVAKMVDSREGRFDVKVYYELYEYFGEEAHIKAIRDSLGFELQKTKEEIVPFKIIKISDK